MVEVFVLEFKKEKREHGPPLPWYRLQYSQRQPHKKRMMERRGKVENSESLEGESRLKDCVSVSE